MKKIILLGAMLLVVSYGLIAEEVQHAAIGINQARINQEELNDGKKNVELYPKNHKTFFLSLDNQADLLKKLLESKGKDEVIRYFLSLRNHDSKKALDLLSQSANEELRLVILENLTTEEFADLLNTLFDHIGGEAIAHWAYKSEGIDVNDVTLEDLYKGLSHLTGSLENVYLIPSARAQQYVNFYMQYKTSKMLGGLSYANDEEVLKSRGKKIAEVLNRMDEDKVIDLLYGRFDTRFVNAKDRIVKGDARNDYYSKEYAMKISNDNYVYQVNQKQVGDRWEWKTQNEFAFKEHTSLSRVFSKSINYIVPHLKTRLVVSIFEKETKGDVNALVALVKSLGCEKAFNELFEYLEDAVKDKVYESCADNNALFEMLGIDPIDDDILKLGSEVEKKEL